MKFTVAALLVATGFVNAQKDGPNRLGPRSLADVEYPISSMSALMLEGAPGTQYAKAMKMFKSESGELDAKASKSKSGKSCPLEHIPINGEDFGEPAWEEILELVFPPYAPPENGCPRLDDLGGNLLANFSTFPTPEAGKWNPCYYTKAFAGLDPILGGYPTPIDTHYPYEFAAPFLRQPGDGSVHHCDGTDPLVDIGACPKLGHTCGKDCTKITDNYGIGHVPPFVPLAAVKNAYGKCGNQDICLDWFEYSTNGCNIKKSILDELVYEYFGEGDEVKFQPPILLPDANGTLKPSNTYYRLEYGGQSPACNNENCRGPHYCTTDVAEEGNIWGDFCPYVHTGEDSGLYRHPHLALAALELWIANQCMPDKCPIEWLDSPNGQDYATSDVTATSITWAEMEDNYDPMSQPSVPYEWPNSGSGIYPGIELYPPGKCTKHAPGLYATEFAGSGPGC